MLNPLSDVITERNQYIEKIHDDIQRAEQELSRVRNQLSAAEQKARSDAHRRRKEIEAMGVTEAEQIFTENKKEMDGIKQESEKKIAIQLEEARQWIEKESKRLSIVIMEKILERKIA
jgi:F0F1-type ATP synthase membrane subunit b/b'